MRSEAGGGGEEVEVTGKRTADRPGGGRGAAKRAAAVTSLASLASLFLAFHENVLGVFLGPCIGQQAFERLLRVDQQRQTPQHVVQVG